MMYTSYERDDVMIMRESKFVRFKSLYTRSLYLPWVNGWMFVSLHYFTYLLNYLNLNVCSEAFFCRVYFVTNA